MIGSGCSKSIAPGTNYPAMGGAIQQSSQQSIYLSRAGQQLSCGSTLQPGEKLAVSGFAPPQDAQYVVQATSSSGSGSWGVQGGACSNSRTISSTSPEVVAPSSGSVTVQAAWATGRNGIMATAACSYSVQGTGTSSSTGTSTGSTGGTSAASRRVPGGWEWVMAAVMGVAMMCCVTSGWKM
ncbi:hypothetical protein GUITHDRAFT_120386 [Guillardia theta CCMP2712]|uniref:Uncharacterized protein n=2 Tax=Guillardia theta TaxID=55529 RepID=L1IBI2_GUITC|nr:hypothetical protein GUITHDRAFT_120386 [Guillardia theta CCMP2712]EKX33437.1 hypothetical protein GUITHDRAFT_120386 [Guillardia theta CCMP2712]|eukprot:XP_005820417.1 hypothetical protein GUITHDRAFT_120386 [Guillardia theta CCMP2712]